MSSRVIVALCALTLVCAVKSALAFVPLNTTVQGKVTDAGGNPITGDQSFVFKIFDAVVNGTEVWPGNGIGEQQTVYCSPEGLWTAQLGLFFSLNDAVFSGPQRYLEITVNGTILPRIQLVSDPYALRIGTVDGASGGNITSSVSIGPGHTNAGADGFVAGYGNFLTGSRATITGGLFNSATADYATVSGGSGNQATGLFTTIGGGAGNTASGSQSTICGGLYNQARGAYSIIVGGGGFSIADSNAASGDYSVIVGGTQNIASGGYSFIGGGGYNGISSTAEGGTVGGGVANGVSGLNGVVAGGNSGSALGAYSSVGGGLHNQAQGEGATVAGGGYNAARGLYATVSGGGGPGASDSNSANGYYATVSGGSQNAASGRSATVGGGWSNTASNEYASVAGGFNNHATEVMAAIGGGTNNYATAHAATVAGGSGNFATGLRSMIPGGEANTAQGRFSCAAGHWAFAAHDGCFVWADTLQAGFASTAPNQFIIRATGGVGVGVSNPQQDLSVLRGMNIDQANSNNGTSTFGLSFGSGSGEVIASKRTVGGNQFGLDFYTNFTNRMSITNGGYVGIGVAGPAYRLELPNVLSPDGQGRANAWVIYSSRRWKENIKTINNALEKVEKLRGVEYDNKSDGAHSIGLIAEEVGEVIPEVVNYEENGVDAQSIDYARLVALLIEGMKEQQKRIEQLEQTVRQMAP